MKDGELLQLLTTKWQSVNKIKEKAGGHWNKVLSQLMNLESKGLVEHIDIQRRKVVYRHFKLPSADEHTLDIIERTELEYRSDKDHKYIVKHKHTGNLKKYIDEIIRRIKDARE